MPGSEKNKLTIVERKSKEYKKVQFKCDTCDYNYKKK